jgi:hypothetical protein
MKPEHKPGHGKPPTVPVVDGTVLRNLPQYDAKGVQNLRRLDVQDESGNFHVNVSEKHPLAKAKVGARLTIISECE